MTHSKPNTPEENSDGAELNLRAYLAMSRVEANVLDHLVALLRSDAPIDPMIRTAMADAFEGKCASDRVTFKITDQKAGSLGDFSDRRHRFFRDMDIALFIEERRAPPDNLTLELAAREASRVFPLVGEKTCLAAVDKARKMQVWVDQNFPERPDLYRNVTDDQYRHFLQSEYFYLFDSDQLSRGNRFS